MRLTNAISRYSDAMAARGYAVRTIQEYRWVLDHFAHWASESGVDTLQTIDRELLRQFQAAQLTEKTDQGEPLSQGRVAFRLTVIRQFFRYLVRQGVMLIDPSVNVELPRKRPRSIPYAVLTVKEVDRLLATPDVRSQQGIRDRAILEVFYGTGLRRSELLSLDVADVDLDTRSVTVRRGKGGQGRVVPLNREACVWLDRYLDQVRPLFTSVRGGSALFLSEWRRRMSSKHVGDLVRGYGKRAKLTKKVSPHALRHACATHMLEAGADIRALQIMLGHRLLSTTAGYTHVGMAHLKRVVKRCHPRGRARAHGQAKAKGRPGPARRR
jgi:integrase/recombinase XerD